MNDMCMMLQIRGVKGQLIGDTFMLQEKFWDRIVEFFVTFLGHIVAQVEINEKLFWNFFRDTPRQIFTLSLINHTVCRCCDSLWDIVFKAVSRDDWCPGQRAKA